MRVDVFEQATSNLIEEGLEMPCVPQIGSILEFDHGHGLIQRYRVVNIEHSFIVRKTGEAVKNIETAHDAITCMVENC